MRWPWKKPIESDRRRLWRRRFIVVREIANDVTYLYRKYSILFKRKQ